MGSRNKFFLPIQTTLMSFSKNQIAIDCFSGCGGMSQGFKDAGFNVVGAIENDSKMVEVYKENHPVAHLWNRDIRSISAQEIMDELEFLKGDLDLLGGCPPCQGFSTLRTRNGKLSVADERNDLIYEFLRLVLDLHPKYVMLENVPALFNDKRMTDFITVLEHEGYTVKADVLNTSNYGVPQRRRRTVVVASRISTPTFGKIQNQTATVRKAIGDLPPAGSSGDPVHDLPEKRSAVVLDRIRLIPKDGGSRSSLPNHLALDCHSSTNGFKDVYGRMAWDSPSPTITTGCFNPSKGRFLHPEEDRAITIREAALLQSFPRDYIFPPELGKVKLAQMIGNALPPTFISNHASALISTE